LTIAVLLPFLDFLNHLCRFYIKSLVDKHRGDGKQSTELFNSVVSDLLESDKKLPLKTYEHVTGLLSNAVRNYIPKYGRPYSMSELKHILT
jgi:hypothetical protein